MNEKNERILSVNEQKSQQTKGWTRSQPSEPINLDSSSSSFATFLFLSLSLSLSLCLSIRFVFSFLLQLLLRLIFLVVSRLSTSGQNE